MINPTVDSTLIGVKASFIVDGESDFEQFIF